MHLIECQGVWKTFRRTHGGWKRLLRDRILHMMRKSEREDFHALRDVSFTVEEGESVAVVGRNGAGKSTLLSLISGLALPDRGKIKVRGRIAPLLELGAGFHPDLTGRENLLLNAALMGFHEREIYEAFEEIVEFAGLEEVIDEPIRTYSTGMAMRLAFSIAVNVQPELLIVDEVLAVGDQAFTAKCLDRIHELKRSGKTFVCVSHSAGILQTLCTRAIWLDAGEMVMQGSIGEVLEAYSGEVTAEQHG